MDRLWNLENKPRKVYVAASISAIREAREFATHLNILGIEVTSRWLTHNFSDRPPRSDAKAFEAFERLWGTNDLEDVAAADTLVVLTEVPSSSGGFHVELGYFLGLGRTNVLVVGNLPNVFFWTKNVRLAYTHREALEFLKRQLSRTYYVGHDHSKGIELDGQKHDDVLSATWYDAFVDRAWFYDPSKHGNMPELGYIALKLAGEAGELAEKVAKVYRDSEGVVVDPVPILREAGDVQFCVTKLAHEFRMLTHDVMSMNVAKIEDRAARGVLRGSGDDR